MLGWGSPYCDRMKPAPLSARNADCGCASSSASLLAMESGQLLGIAVIAAATIYAIGRDSEAMRHGDRHTAGYLPAAWIIGVLLFLFA